MEYLTDMTASFIIEMGPVAAAPGLVEGLSGVLPVKMYHTRRLRRQRIVAGFSPIRHLECLGI